MKRINVIILTGIVIASYLMIGATSVKAEDIFVSPNGSDQNSGIMDEPFQTIAKGLDLAVAGDTVYLREGTYTEKVSFPKAGNSDNRIILKAYNKEAVVIQGAGPLMVIDKPYITVEDMVLDAEWSASDGVIVKTDGNFCVLRNLEIKNTMRDGLEMHHPEGVLVENCVIHDAIWFDDAGKRQDAHGIVTEGVQNLTIRDTEIYYVSGDALQFQYSNWNNITVENCVLWNGPLPSARGGAPAGVNPGEDGVDTKYDPPARGKLFIKNTIAHGWRSDFISNPAAFNIKHNVEVIFDGVTAYDNEIAFRLRGPGSKGGAWVTLKNAVIFDSTRGVRYEDDIENLRIHNCTFGDGLGKIFEEAAADASVLDVKNCLFLADAKPSEASDDSNIAVDASAFISVADQNYHLAPESNAIDKGVSLSEVGIDREGTARPQGDGYDVGAYEFFEMQPVLLDAINILRLLAGMATSMDIQYDFNNDKSLGLEDAIHILLMLSEQGKQ